MATLPPPRVDKEFEPTVTQNAMISHECPSVRAKVTLAKTKMALSHRGPVLVVEFRLCDRRFVSLKPDSIEYQVTLEGLGVYSGTPGWVGRRHFSRPSTTEKVTSPNPTASTRIDPLGLGFRKYEVRRRMLAMMPLCL
ncbi:hypothetical protein AVEN_123693-1 [Araneus ventricosus]|uniref:Uncharacterized protein n=1 Tax=Araneus ventricosus TaxID=182803 RepID=A0A4Y2HGL8_ARAVE|nr:hypothetical protein AVEN_123693-1 [Araneus ventricosus]